MLKTTGLRLAQAPPIHVPFRFFLTAPFFLVAAALILGWQGDSVFVSRWSPASLAVTHLITVGFLGQVMCGTLLQMLPVVAGAPVPAVLHVGAVVHALLAVGAGLLSWGFLGGGRTALTAGAVTASLGFLIFLVFAGAALIRAKGAPQTLWAIRLALTALFITFSLGLLLTAALRGWVMLDGVAGWVDLHLAWGLLGWVGLLMVGIAYQVVPMFHVTPPYPRWLSHWLAPVVAVALAAASLLKLCPLADASTALLWGPAAGFAVFALVTLRLQIQRERKRIDAALLCWWAAMACILAAVPGWALGQPVLAGVLLLVGVGIGLPIAMLVKIVPFLAWFHLQNRQIASTRFDVRIPHMLRFLPEAAARLLFVGHLVTLLGLLAAYLAPDWVYLPAAALGFTAVGLAAVLITSVVRFRLISAALRRP